MPNPEGIPTVTLHGLFVEPNAAGTPLQGTVTFTPSPSVITFPDQNVIVAGTETATLDGTGAFTIQLIATDTANQNPTGWTYTVTEKLIGPPQRSYQIFLPYTVATVELADITPTVTAPTYLPVVGPQGPPGIVTSVNGYSAASITLNATDVGAISLAQKAAASGVASLDSSSHLLTTVYDFGAAAASVGNAGTTGASGKPAQSDHVHAGVDLVNAQTVAGIKTFSSIPLLPASDPTTANQASRKAYVDAQVATSVLLTGAQTVAGVKTFSSSPIVPDPTTAQQVASKNYIDIAGTFTGAKTFTNASSAAPFLIASATGDTQNRFQAAINGTLSWGSGALAPDVTLSRTAGGSLSATSNYQSTRATNADTAFTALVVADGFDRFRAYVDGKLEWGPGNVTRDVNLYRIAVDNLQTDDRFSSLRPLSTSSTFGTLVTGDTVDRFSIRADGQHSWGPGSATAQDSFLIREAANSLATTDTLIRTYRASGVSVGFAARVAADTQNRYEVLANGKNGWGPGNAAIDTVLYRNAAGELKTDTNLTVAGSIKTGMASTYVEVTSAAAFSTTTWAVYSTALSTTIVAPPSGRIQVMGHIQTYINTSGAQCYSNIEASGATSGVVHTAQDSTAVHSVNWNTGDNNVVPGAIMYQLSGLVPGEVVTLTWKHRVTSNAAVFEYRNINAFPLM